ncbi:MAG: PUR family DNA/RNA-binding protein [Bacteroidaceae bacterium]|nr:PUR family DNA/RNA-binding protein [Bacteroidaceae bacterium]
MEEYKKSGMSESEKEIVFSQAIKAGKRIYYIDVKKNRKEEMYLSITESKKIVSGEGEDALVTFEKHKIFLYREDFEKFATSLRQAIDFVVAEQGEYQPRYQEPVVTEPHKESEEDNLKIDIEF